MAPSNFQAVNIRSTGITFSWNPLVDQANGIIQFYVITCTADGNIIIVVSLMVNYMYICKEKGRGWASSNQAMVKLRIALLWIGSVAGHGWDSISLKGDGGVFW